MASPSGSGDQSSCGDVSYGKHCELQSQYDAMVAENAELKRKVSGMSIDLRMQDRRVRRFPITLCDIYPDFPPQELRNEGWIRAKSMNRDEESDLIVARTRSSSDHIWGAGLAALLLATFMEYGWQRRDFSMRPEVQPIVQNCVRLVRPLYEAIILAEGHCQASTTHDCGLSNA